MGLILTRARNLPDPEDPAGGIELGQENVLPTHVSENRVSNRSVSAVKISGQVNVPGRIYTHGRRTVLRVGPADLPRPGKGGR